MWSLRTAYATAWEMYRYHLVKRTIHAGELARLCDEFDIIFFTAPRMSVWCSFQARATKAAEVRKAKACAPMIRCRWLPVRQTSGWIW